MIKNITLLACSLFIGTMAFAQNPCGTTISFLNVPQTLCSSLVRLDPINPSPRGGVFSGPIISANGMLSYAGMPAGTYTVYYTAPDTCGTMDSLDIEIISIASDATIFDAFDCASTAGTELFINASQNESIYLQQGNDQIGFIDQGRSEMLTITSGARIDVIVTNNTGDCYGDIVIPTFNAPRVRAELDYNCAQYRTLLNYVGPSNVSYVIWQRYDQQPGDLPSLVTSGTVSVPLDGIGNYSMRAIFDNGCENLASVNVPIAVGITPAASTGSRSYLDCTATATDSIGLLGNSGGNTTIGWSWSTIDGTSFPSDSTLQRPMIPGIPATYVLRTINPISGCFSEPDTAFITRSVPDTSDVSATICEGEVFTLNNQDFSVGGNYESIETGTDDCDDLTYLSLVVNPAPDVNFNVSGPDSTGGYEIQIFGLSSTVTYDYLWCNGETGNSIIVYQSQQCEVTITDPTTGCSTIEIISVTTSSTQQAIPGSFTLAPNPVSDFVTWSYSGTATLLSTSVHSATGQLIAKTSGQDVSNQRIDLSATPAGMYTITWMDSDGRRTSKRVMRL